MAPALGLDPLRKSSAWHPKQPLERLTMSPYIQTLTDWTRKGQSVVVK